MLVAYTIPTEFTAAYQQQHSYTVTPNGSQELPGFTIFPNVTTSIEFSMPSNATLHYMTFATVVLQVAPSPSNPSRYKLVVLDLGSGNATDQQTLPISGNGLPFAVNSTISFYTAAGVSFNASFSSRTDFNSTVNFDPPIAITGLATFTVSMILIATISGIKPDEV